MMHKDVLITDYVHPTLLQGLETMGFTSTYAPAMARKEMESVLHHFQGVIINTRCAIDANTLIGAPDLRWIARLGSGLDIIDLEVAKRQGVDVLSAPEGNAVAVAEHAMGMLLSLTNKLNSANRNVCEGEWSREQHRGMEISGKTIGIIGYGNNGSAFARLWAGWDVRVLVYDKYLKGFGVGQVEEVELNKVQREADIISLHVPLTAETREMVDDAFISKCKSGFMLINTSRGKNIKLSDVLTALSSGQLGGACLDVLPYEPPMSGPEEYKNIFAALCAKENVVLSPHVAGWTVESKRKIAEVLLKKIASLSKQD